MSDDAPWQKYPLSDWSICGMNHYHVSGARFLFVSMVKGQVCITEEGADDSYIWERLANKALSSERKYELVKPPER